MNTNVETCHGMSPVIKATKTNETRRGVSLQTQLKRLDDKNNIRKFGKPIKNFLSTMINQYKDSVTRECNLNNLSSK